MWLPDRQLEREQLEQARSLAVKLRYLDTIDVICRDWRPSMAWVFLLTNWPAIRLSTWKKYAFGNCTHLLTWLIQFWWDVRIWRKCYTPDIWDFQVLGLDSCWFRLFYKPRAIHGLPDCVIYVSSGFITQTCLYVSTSVLLARQSLYHLSVIWSALPSPQRHSRVSPVFQGGRIISISLPSLFLGDYTSYNNALYIWRKTKCNHKEKQTSKAPAFGLKKCSLNWFCTYDELSLGSAVALCMAYSYMVRTFANQTTEAGGDRPTLHFTCRRWDMSEHEECICPVGLKQVTGTVLVLEGHLLFEGNTRSVWNVFVHTDQLTDLCPSLS